MSLAHATASKALETDGKTFKRNLSSYAIVDIAILESVAKTESGVYGSLRSSRSAGDGGVLRYSNVELLNVGSTNGGFSVGGDGEDLYLVFSTVTSMMSSLTRETDPDPDAAYSARGMKGIPVASALGWLGKAGFDRAGNFVLEFPDSTLSFNIDSSVSYQHQNILKAGKGADGSLYASLLAGIHQLFLMPDGSWYTCTWANNGFVQDLKIRKTDGSVIQRRWSTSVPSNAQKGDLPSFTAFLYEEVFNPDGSSLITYRNSGGTTIASESVATNGKRVLTSAGFEVNAGTGKIKLATTAFNYSSWLASLIDQIKAIVVTGGYTVLPANQVLLDALKTELQAGTE